MNGNEVVLTAYCMAYNHEKYIGKTLEGFVSQRTSYKYKVIVHDDASTDGTAGIIKSYAEKYPDIIVPVLQKENQYSKHKDLFDIFIKPMLEGKYVAVCEGDDYWCDPEKLQKQIDFMESHPDFSACVHNTEKIREDGSSTGIFYNNDKSDREIPAGEIIKRGSCFIHLNSIVCRREFRENKPEEFFIPKAGDYTLLIYLATVGKIWYMADVMSKYRMFSPGSWSEKMKLDKSFRMEHARSTITALEKMNEYTKGRYSDSFEQVIKYSKARNLYYEKGFMGVLLHPVYWDVFVRKLVEKIAGR